MNFISLLFQLLLLVTFCMALGNQDDGAGAKASSTSVTIAWITVTTNGVVNTVQTTYVQTFPSRYSEPTSAVQAGSIGMGTNTAQVGQVRTYSQTTISNGAAVIGTSFFGTLCLILGWLF